MDIRVIDRENRRVVNVSRISLEAQGKYVVGITEEGKLVKVKECYDEQEAKRSMEEIIEEIREASLKGEENVILEL